MIKCTTQVSPKVEEQQYPFLGVTEYGKVVLFYKEREGIVMVACQGSNPVEDFDDVGDVIDDWFMELFVAYDEKIYIENTE